MLEPYDTNWVEAGVQRTTRYTNLDPEEYTFRVIASNSDGVGNEKGASINLIINKPWWETYLAFLVYLLLGFGFLYSLRRYEMSRQRLKYNLQLGNLETEKLKEVDQIKSRFFANISHEFRTPLTLIFGPAKDIKDNVKDENIKKSAGMIQKNAARLYGLVNQLLDLSKLEAGKMKLETREQDIIPLLKGLVLSFTSLAERKKIILKFESKEENIKVFVDKDKIEKIINNILSNAFKFTPEGGEIDVKVLKLKKEVEIIVKDTGIGIPEERIEKIFDRFYQVDGSSTREGEGTGIGLALTKELVELHKGFIGVESREGEGTTFKIEIPLGKEHLKNEEIVKKENPKEETMALEKSDIISGIEIAEENSVINKIMDTDLSGENEGKPLLLIVEDNFDVRNYIISNLEEDYKIHEAADGVEGFTKSVENFPDLIISDVMMPKMDGFELCEKLKTDERTSHIPIILLTAKATSENKIEGYETGADDYIMKPFDAKELLARIKNLINQRKQLRKHFQKEGIFNLENKKIISVDKKFLEKAVKVINENISDTSFGVELFASNLAISRAALHKKLIALIGEPPSELIKRIRLSKAGILLKNKTGNISEIALEVGFNNPAYFSECFKKQFGSTPSQYQRNFKQS
jgi:signal transduction histidine kinase/DNA-binding response OmpR family regulator